MAGEDGRDEYHQLAFEGMTPDELESWIVDRQKSRDTLSREIQWAQDVLRIARESRMSTIGPAIEDGFYYDFFREEPFSTDDFAAIEKKMAEIVDRARVAETLGVEDSDGARASRRRSARCRVRSGGCRTPTGWPHRNPARPTSG